MAAPDLPHSYAEGHRYNGAAIEHGRRSALVPCAVQPRDVAIIHARTSYKTEDGEQRHGRYTDVWARRGGAWLAVSAHVTR